MNEKKRPYVLVSNDDGIEAPGIHALADALAPDYDLLVVAPNEERSATGHAISVLREMQLEEYKRDGERFGWALEGNPADCVKLAVDVMAKDRPFDLVVSGINRGQNLGINVLYSGTVAAAREGVLLGLPSIAFSCVYTDINNVRFDTAARVAQVLVPRVIERGLPSDVLLNVNVPPVDFEELNGFAITRQGLSAFRDRFEQLHVAPEEIARYRNIGDRFYPSPEEHLDTDDHAIAKNKVSITPLHTDTTAHKHLQALDDLTDL